MGIISSIRKYGYYDNYGDRFRLFVGNFSQWEQEQSGCRKGPEIGFNISVYDHVGEFDQRAYGENWEHDSRWYLSHHASIQVWHWAVTLTVRGKRINGPQWDALPDEDDEAA